MQTGSLEPLGTPPTVDHAVHNLTLKFLRFWSYPILSSPARWLLLIVVAIVCLARAWIRLKGMQAYSHDAFLLLDGAWRMLNGQRPYIDFFTNVGVLAYTRLWSAFRLLTAMQVDSDTVRPRLDWFSRFGHTYWDEGAFRIPALLLFAS